MADSELSRIQPTGEGGASVRPESSSGPAPRRRTLFRPYFLGPQTSATTSTMALSAGDVRNASSIATVPGTSTAVSLPILPSADTVTNVAATTAIVPNQQTPGCPADSEANSSLVSGAAAASKAPRRWEQWNGAEITAFFEGVKQFGKDFDQVAKLMTRRKLNKDKDQIRNYYFNSLKLLRSTARIDEDLIADVPRDARELFIVINGFEWKRKICAKFDPTKLKQLIMDGSTTVKTKKKKQLMVIRTPICPALQKFFPSCKCSSPLPSHIIICLTPKTEADRSFVEQCGQNPLIKIKIAIGDELSRVFAFLKAKWASRLQKLAENGQQMEEQMKLVLYPDKSTRLGKVIVKLYEATPMIFSLNRLKKERIQRNENQSAELSEGAGATGNEGISGSEVTPVEEDGPFILNEYKLRAGLTENNIHQATATELYYLCGKEIEIRLLYSTGVTRVCDPEPWSIFVSLINRNYGDTLCKYLADPERIAELEKFSKNISEDKSRKRRTSIGNDNTSTPQTTCTTNALSEPTETLGTAGAMMVEAENTAFMRQLESLQVKKRARSFHQRRPGKKNTAGYKQADVYLTAEHNMIARNQQQCQSFFIHHHYEHHPEVNSGHFVLPANDEAVMSSNGHYTHGANIIEKTLTMTELSAVDMGCGGSSNMMISPSKESTLPEDVRSSMEMMLQQNSVDYCRNFADLVTTIEATPIAISTRTDGDTDMALGPHAAHQNAAMEENSPNAKLY